MLEKVMEQLSKDGLCELFKPYDIRHNPDEYNFHVPKGVFREASVLIGLFYRDGDYRVILTVRSKALTHHAGIVAFPGGMRDKEDRDEAHCALREAEEEIGLDPSYVDVLCVGVPSVVSPNILTTPVIAIIQPDFKLKMNESEVSLIFDLPLSRFLRDDGLIIRDFHAHDTVYHTHHYIDHIDGQEVDTWGFTASYCISAALVLYQSKKTFCLVANDIMSKDTVFKGEWLKKMIENIGLRSKY